MNDVDGGTDRAGLLWRFHLGAASVRGAGRFEVRRGPAWRACVLAALLRLPEQGSDVLVRASIVRTGAVERWTRTFGERRYVSGLVRRGTLAVERIGPLELRFRLSVDREHLSLTQEAAAFRVGSLRAGFPAWLAPCVTAHAEGRGPNTFFVAVDVTAPLVGPLLSYRGQLTEET